MTTKKALDQARILATHVRGKRDQDFLQAFLKDTELQARPSAQRYVGGLWSRFLGSQQGQMLAVVHDAKPQDMQEARLLRGIRAKLEQGQRLLPRERDVVESLLTPKGKTSSMDPEVLRLTRELMERMSPMSRSDRDVRALCGHMQQWLRKQGIQ